MSASKAVCSTGWNLVPLLSSTEYLDENGEGSQRYAYAKQTRLDG